MPYTNLDINFQHLAKNGVEITLEPSSLNASGITPMLFSIENLAAGADIADRYLFAVPTGYKMTVLDASIIPSGDDAGIDASNTCVVALAKGTDVIATKTYDGTEGKTFPDAGAVGALTVDTAKNVLAAGSVVKVSVTNGATADLPACVLQVTVKIEKV